MDINTNVNLNAQYSSIGHTLAKTAYDAADNTQYADSANRILWDGYDSIQGSSGTTADEKALARMGHKIATNSLEKTEHNRIAFSIMSSIASAIPGPMGQVIAKVAVKAADNVEYAKSANQVLWGGYNAILDNPRVSDRDKQVAELGNKIAANSLDSVEHNRIAFPIMRAIAGGVQGPMGTALARIAYDAADNVHYAKSANQVLWAGFDAVQQNPESTQSQKEIAKAANEFASHSHESTEHNRAAFRFMKSIIDEGNK